jgi:hypothetical protein
MADKPRRLFGLFLGGMMGLLYGLGSQYVNVLVLAGLPLAQPPGGRLALALWSMMGGAFLGMLAAWPDEALPGILLSCLVGAATYSLFHLWRNTSGLERLTGVLALIFTLLPRAFLFLPFSALIRWSLSRWGNELRRADYSLLRLALSPLLLLFLALVAGSLALYPPEARQALRTTHNLVQSGRRASTPSELPHPLQSVDGFLQKASGDYTLQLSDNPEVLPLPRPSAPYGVTEYVVLVRFANGFRLGCVFVQGYPIVCGSY